ncbi:aspartyl protease family protein 2 [Tanacetum coccineum]
MLRIILLTFINICHSTTVNHHYLRLPLLHVNPQQSPSEAVSADTARLSTLHRRRHPNLPLTSGAYAGAGQYFVTLHLGTPPQPLLLIADTGSDLVWVACSACRDNCAATRPPHSAFLARHSSSYCLHHCYEPECGLVPHPRPERACNKTRFHTPCRYEYSYADGSITNGFFAKEKTSFNSSSGGLELLQHDSLAFGCGFEVSGPSVSGPSFNGAQGVMGLGRGPVSLVTQLGSRFGNKFSYCLKDYTKSPPPTSYLLIGVGAKKSRMRYTPLQANPLSSTFYYISVQSVYVDNVKLRISPTVWNIDKMGNGGTIIDSGTTLTFLPDPAYRHVVAAFRRRVKLPTPDGAPPNFDLCYNVSGVSRLSLPRLSFKLVGNSLFSPAVGNYFIDTAEDVKCLALQSVTSPGGLSVIGNLMQQGFLFEFDIGKSQLGFSHTGCS